MKTIKTDLQKLTEKISLTLESCIQGLHVTETAITEDDFLVITFINRQGQDDAICIPPSLWPTLPFFDLIQLLIEKVHSTLPSPRSTLTH